MHHFQRKWLKLYLNQQVGMSTACGVAVSGPQGVQYGYLAIWPMAD
jgi:hypothetical protein